MRRNQSTVPEKKQTQLSRFHPLLPALHEDDGGVRISHLPLFTTHQLAGVAKPLQVASWNVKSDFLKVNKDASAKHIKDVLAKGRELVDAIWSMWNTRNVDIFLLQEAFFLNESLDAAACKLQQAGELPSATPRLSELISLYQGDSKESSGSVRSSFESKDQTKGWRYHQAGHLIVLYNPKKVKLKQTGVPVFAEIGAADRAYVKSNKEVAEGEAKKELTYKELCLATQTQALEFDVVSSDDAKSSSSFKLCNVAWRETDNINETEKLIKLLLVDQPGNMIAGDFGNSVVIPQKPYLVNSVELFEEETGVASSARYTEGFFVFGDDRCIHQLAKVDVVDPKNLESKKYDTSPAPRLEDFSLPQQKEELSEHRRFVTLAKEHSIADEKTMDCLKRNKIFVEQLVNAYNHVNVRFYLGRESALLSPKFALDIHKLLLEDMLPTQVKIKEVGKTGIWFVEVSKENDALNEVIEIFMQFFRNEIQQNNVVLEHALQLIDQRLALLEIEADAEDKASEGQDLGVAENFAKIDKVLKEIKVLTELKDRVLSMIKFGVKSPNPFRDFNEYVNEYVNSDSIKQNSTFSATLFSGQTDVGKLLKHLCKLDVRLEPVFVPVSQEADEYKLSASNLKPQQ